MDFGVWLSPSTFPDPPILVFFCSLLFSCCDFPLFPEGSHLEKKISLERLKFSSFRLIFSISLENFLILTLRIPTKIRVWWVARLKFSIPLENVIRFNLA